MRCVKSNSSVIFFFCVIIFAACTKEKNDHPGLHLPVTLMFDQVRFVGEIQGYNYNGDRTTEIPEFLIPNDFLMDDGKSFPFDYIEISKDSSVSCYYKKQGYNKVDSGQITMISNDSLRFVIQQSSEIVCKGLLDAQKLKFTAFGAWSIYSDRWFYEYYFDFGEYNIQEVIEEGYHRTDTPDKSFIYVQQFDCLYDIIYN